MSLVEDINYVARKPRLTEAIIVVYTKDVSGLKATEKDIIYWLGVNDQRAADLLRKLEVRNLVKRCGEGVEITDRGRDVVRGILNQLGIYDVSLRNLGNVIENIRYRHMFYKARYSHGSFYKIFSASIEPTPKIELLNVLWSELSIDQKLNSMVFIAMDYERKEDTIRDKRRAELAELSGILRTVRLYALALPPNMLGVEVSVDPLINDVGERWRFAGKLKDDPDKRWRYLKQVDALYLARFKQEDRKLSPLHATGFSAFRWLGERIDNVFKYSVDFYQPIAAALYSVIYNKALAITEDQILEGEGAKILERAMDAVGKKEYRDVVRRVLEARLYRYGIVEIIDRDRRLAPTSIFHRAAVWKGTRVEDVRKSISMILEGLDKDRVLLEYIVKKCVITPHDMSKDLGIPASNSVNIVQSLAEVGLLIPSHQRYMWVGIAPANFIEEAMGRDVFIILYDITKKFEEKLSGIGVDVIEIIEKLAGQGTLDVYSYVEKGREYLEIYSYLYELNKMRLIEVEQGYARVVDNEAKNLLNIFVTVMKVPRSLDIVSNEVIKDIPSAQKVKEIRSRILQLLSDSIAT